MESTTKYNVYRDGVMIASYDNQAPATVAAKRYSKYHKVDVSVVEEVFAHVSSREVRKCIGGVIFPCS